jgi:molybdopterin-guanine dinucleotide biosynthesis protein A
MAVEPARDEKIQEFWLAAEILISARTDRVWRPSDTEFVADPTAAGVSRGALSGTAAALARIRTKYLLALAIDMPFMTEKYLHFLCDEIAPGRGVLAVIAGRAEPLAAIYPLKRIAMLSPRFPTPSPIFRCNL